LLCVAAARRRRRRPPPPPQVYVLIPSQLICLRSAKF